MKEKFYVTRNTAIQPDGLTFHVEVVVIEKISGYIDTYIDAVGFISELPIRKNEDYQIQKVFTIN